MILPDVNVLVSAFRADAEQHEPYAAWLHEVVSTGASLALCDHGLAGFMRVVTHPRIADRGFARYPGLHWFDPAAEPGM